MASGHYISYLKASTGSSKSWSKVSDSMVTACDTFTKQPTMAFFECQPTLNSTHLFEMITQILKLTTLDSSNAMYLYYPSANLDRKYNDVKVSVSK